ncbi:LuxR family transcriptional regulator [Ktedonosporobacter rubrisoli]|uniref:LuxR family transcriptional regulator n=1 Tax=Ktedonosporobacter rubrisoli TaxID=2509675 RepID=A0A4P6JP05_KTERU|nr:LuxR C-terminal-related transcriptional regulator [Ktedonosporobacter rubrisoli]QBD76913.1 LuxR family transcriptional regulator [Ktedonosporobacter rubrisoli]
MPKPALHALIWSEELQCYELKTGGQLYRSFRQEDEPAWLAWMQENRAFAFEGRAGHLSIVKEARPRGTGYWYAYSRQARRTRKRYLGRSATFSRLEQVATDLISKREIAIKLPTQTMRAAPKEPRWPFSNRLPERRDVLLATKLFPPQLPALLVERERLLKDLDAVLSHRLGLLSAAAGSGKTTLLSTWAARKRASGQLVAWLSLEEQDNDPASFWNYVVAALRIVEPAAAETARSMLQAPSPPSLATILASFINDLAATQKEIVLILDDFHVINDPDIISSIQYLLEHLPARLHLILAGRSNPQLALPRLRARSQLVELRDKDLRFTRAEAEHFFARAMERPLARVEIDVLEQRIEGWIAGLQLAALAMRTRENYTAFVQQLSGNQRFILEYMQEEILERQSPELQDFLIHTAILARLHAPLCQAVTVENSIQVCQQMLLTLESANLFLIPLDGERRWYRFHSLFRDVLLARLQALYPERIPVLHRRAADWYAQQGNIHEAITHALAGSAYVFAAELMEQSAAYMCFNGGVSQLYGWIKSLPEAILLAHADLALTTALQILYQSFYSPDEAWQQAVAEAELVLVPLAAQLQAQGAAFRTEPALRSLQNRLDLLYTWMASRAAILQENVAQMRLLSSQLQELARDESVVWKMLPVHHLLVKAANARALLPMLSDLRQQAEKEPQPYEAVWLMEQIGEAYRDAGQLQRAYQIVREALERLLQMGKARSMFGYIHLRLAELHWAWNQLAEARSHLDAALQFARTWQHTDIQIASYAQLIRILLVKGEWREAEQALDEAERLSRASQWKHQRRLVTAARAFLWLARGELTAAAAWADHYELDFQVFSRLDNEEYAETLALARVLLALQRNEEARQLLHRLLTRAEQNESAWYIVQTLAFQVVALQANGEDAQARETALRLLRLARPADYLRIYLDAGPYLQHVLQSLLATTVQQEEHAREASLGASVRTLLAAFEQQALPTARASSFASQTIVSGLLSPLTARELEVLHLLEQGKTNQEIANQLIISLATAKKHVANLLGKLEAENRVQAIANARKHGIL